MEDQHIGTAHDVGYKTLADLRAPLNYSDLFLREAAVELEIGAGRGDFLLEYAGLHPQTNFIAVERKLVVLRKIVNKLRRTNLENVQVLNVEIRHFLREYITPNSLAAVHVYFPDPWPKKRHAHRRLMVHPENAELVIRSIQPGGLLHFRTDVPGYYEIAVGLLDAHPQLKRIEIPQELLAVKTGYERRFNEQGIPTNAASYQKL